VPQIRDRRAAGLAVLLALLGSASIMMGLRVEPETMPPVAEALPPAAEVPPSAGLSAPSSVGAATPGDSALGNAASGDTTPGNATPGDVTPGNAAPSNGTPGDVTLGGGTPGAAAALGRSVPVRLEIPAIGLRTPLTELGLARDGTIEVPPLRSGAPAGWYRHSPTPGEPGAAVLVGHVDTAREGPAVFFRLRELRPGDTAEVRRDDGAVARFEVTRIASFPKLEFPTNEVYGAVDQPELRLVTCGGTFDRTKGSYRSNIVVFARMVDALPGSGTGTGNGD
jgi:sortase (surface protein transpeptidase)